MLLLTLPLHNIISFISGVNFTDILRAFFTLTNPKSAKKTDAFAVFLALLGSECIKTAHKMLVKTIPDLFLCWSN
jgi:hypothetical protein